MYLDIGANSVIDAGGFGIQALNYGTGSTIITVNGQIMAGERGIDIYSKDTVSYTSLLVSSGAKVESDGYGLYLRIGAGTNNITVNGDVTAYAHAVYSNSAVDTINLNIGQDAVISSTTTAAIDVNDNNVLNLTIDGATIIGTDGVAIDFRNDDDNLNLAGTVNITGDIEAGTGEDTLSIANTILNMSAGSSFLNFEDVDISGNLTSFAGSNADINSASTIAVTGGILSDIASASSYGKVTAVNGFTFSNSANVSVTTSGRVVDITSGTILTDILSGGDISGLTSGIIEDDNPLYIFTSMVNDDSVDILVTRPDISSFGSSNVKAFASFLGAVGQTTESSGLRSVISDIVQAPNNDIKEKYLQTLLPEANNAKYNVTNDIVKQSVDVTKSRISSLRNFKNLGTGLSTGDVMNLQSSWFSFFNNNISQGYKDREYGYDANIKGVVVGFDSEYSPNTIIGSSLSYASSDISTRVIGSEGSVDSKNVTLYLAHDFSDVIYFDMFSSIGMSTVENYRKLFDSTTAVSKYDGFNIATEGNIGYSAKYKLINVTPYLSTRYNYISYGDYTENGSSAPYSVDETDAEYFTGSLGFKLNNSFKNKNITYTPNFFLELEHEFTGGEVESDVAFVSDPSVVFVNQLNSSGSDTVNLGFGLDIQTTDNIYLSFNYDLEAKKEYRNSNISGGLKIKF
jgi:outer membrane autotransporter protein